MTGFFVEIAEPVPSEAKESSSFLAMTGFFVEIATLSPKARNDRLLC